MRKRERERETNRIYIYVFKHVHTHNLNQYIYIYINIIHDYTMVIQHFQFHPIPGIPREETRLQLRHHQLATVEAPCRSPSAQGAQRSGQRFLEQPMGKEVPILHGGFHSHGGTQNGWFIRSISGKNPSRNG